MPELGEWLFAGWMVPLRPVPLVGEVDAELGLGVAAGGAGDPPGLAEDRELLVAVADQRRGQNVRIIRGREAER